MNPAHLLVDHRSAWSVEVGETSVVFDMAADQQAFHATELVERGGAAELHLTAAMAADLAAVLTATPAAEAAWSVRRMGSDVVVSGPVIVHFTDTRRAPSGLARRIEIALADLPGLREVLLGS